MRRLARVVFTPFGIATVGCLLLFGWALWTGGIADGPIAKQVRVSSVYAAPGVELDTAAAERIIGNRRLIVVMLEPGARLRDGCDQVRRAAAGSVVILLSHDDDDYDTYGCSLIKRTDSEIGRAAVVELTMTDGIDEFHDRPLEAIKIIVVNYDQLVKGGFLPDDARTISPSAPRFLIAAAAVGGVLAGSVVLYVLARRAGRNTAARRADRDRATDSRTMFSAAAAVVAQQIIDLDRRYATAQVTTARPAAQRRQRHDDARARAAGEFATRYRRLSTDYVTLFDEVAAADQRGEEDFSGYTRRAEDLADKLRKLAEVTPS